MILSKNIITLILCFFTVAGCIFSGEFAYASEPEEKMKSRSSIFRRDEFDEEIDLSSFLIEKKIDSEGGTIDIGDDYKLSIKFSENTFDETTSVSTFRFEKQTGLRAYEQIGPVWVVTSKSRPKRKVEYEFTYPAFIIPDDSTLLVLVYSRNNWIISEFPHFDIEDRTVRIKADYTGAFVLVRIRNRSEIDLQEYTFSRTDRRDLEIIGLFRYESKVPKDDDRLEEQLELRDNFKGNILFGPAGEKRRIGVTVLYAESDGKPLVRSFSGNAMIGKDNFRATSYDTDSLKGVISAENKSGILSFEGLPTIVRLYEMRGNRKLYLPTMRDKLTLNGIGFDWQVQEMFHLGNFIYKAELIMPHTAEDATVCGVYLQFIIR